MPARGGGLALAARGSATWIEFYAANAPGGVADCDQVPHTGVRFGAPAADGGAVVVAGHANRLGQGDCAGSRVADDGAGVIHEMGLPTAAS